MDGNPLMIAATKLPLDVGAIHFVGIGGIGMSGIAEVLLNLGYQVQGSDAKASKITARLKTLGALVYDGQRAENLEDAQVVVISSAIKPGNPELDEARRRGLPVVRRAEMLAELMRLKSNVAVAGTHGKTTTTTMVATLLDAGDYDPTVVNGGIIHRFESNARMGQGEWMVVEADESDGTFVRLPATIAVVTNIDPEHMEHYGDHRARCVPPSSRFRGEHSPFYGARRVLRRPCRRCRRSIGPGEGPADRRPTGAARRPTCALVDLRFEGGKSRVFDVDIRYGPRTRADGGSAPCPCRASTTCSNAHGRHRRGAAPGRGRGDAIRRRAWRSSPASSGASPMSVRWNGVHDRRRLRAPPGGDRRGAESRAPASRRRRARDRGASAASLHAPAAILFDDFCACFNDADVVGIVSEVFSAGGDRRYEGATRVPIWCRRSDPTGATAARWRCAGRGRSCPP